MSISVKEFSQLNLNKIMLNEMNLNKLDKLDCGSVLLIDSENHRYTVKTKKTTYMNVCINSTLECSVELNDCVCVLVCSDENMVIIIDKKYKNESDEMFFARQLKLNSLIYGNYRGD